MGRAMKFNLSDPLSGRQITFNITEESKMRMVYNQSISSEFDGGILQDNLKGYLLRISGGSDKQGFGMKKGLATHRRVRLLMTPGDSCFRGRRCRQGERRRKSVRGCLVSPDIASLNVIVVKHGNKPIPISSEYHLSRRPKRSARLCKIFHLMNGRDDVVSYSKSMGSKRERGKQINNFKVSRLLTKLKLQRRKAETV